MIKESFDFISIVMGRGYLLYFEGIFERLSIFIIFIIYKFNINLKLMVEKRILVSCWYIVN